MTKEKYPKIYEYLARIEAMPGYKKAVEKIIEVEGKYEPNI